MNDQQIIERLAEWLDSLPRESEYQQEFFEMMHQGWNPLTDWNHWRQVEEKVLKTKGLTEKFQSFFSVQSNHVYAYMAADLPLRCKALISVLSKNE